MSNIPAQIELFPAQPNEELFPYWREQLKAWPCEIMLNRHARGCTGWSMATQGFCFAEFLFMAGQMTKAEFRRWFRLHRRVLHWNKRP